MMLRAGLRGGGAAPLLSGPLSQPGASLAASTTSTMIEAPKKARRDEEELQAVPAAPLTPAAGPVLDIYGGGMFWFWKVGVLHHLQKHHDLSGVQLHGSSSGAIVAVLAACDVGMNRAAQHTARVLEEHGVYGRLVGVLGMWGAIARRCLEDLLPDDAHQRCTGRVRLRLTAWPSFQPVFIQRFYSKQDVIDACLASGHLPFLLDGRLAATMRGMRAVDGAFCRWAAMLRQQPGALLGAWLRSSSAAGSSGAARLQQPAELPPATPHGQHGQSRRFTLDYVNDDRLERTLRFAAVRLRPAEGLHQLVRCGEAYSQRLHARGVWEAWLGSSGGTGSDVHESNA